MKRPGYCLWPDSPAPGVRATVVEIGLLRGELPRSSGFQSPFGRQTVPWSALDVSESSDHT